MSRPRGNGWRATGPRGTRGRTLHCETGARARNGVGPRAPPSLRSEALAALVAPPLQHRAPSARGHAAAEPVGSGALALLRLIGALHRRREYRNAPAGSPRTGVARLFPRFAASRGGGHDGVRLAP